MSLADELEEARGGVWPDIGNAVRRMGRFDFIAEYLRRHTARKAGRAVVEGYQVVKRRGKWTYRSPSGVEMMPPGDSGKLFDVARRTPLSRYIQQAEEFRIYALSEDDIAHLHLLPKDKKLARARAARGTKGKPSAIGAGSKGRSGLDGYRPAHTVRHQTVGGGY